MHELPCRYDVCPSPSQLSSSALPIVLARSIAPWYGVAGSCTLPITSTLVGVAAVGSGIGVRSGCHCWQPNSEMAAHVPKIGNRVAHDLAVAVICASVGPGFSSLQPIVVFASMMLE